MLFFQSVRACFFKYATFSGRAQRSEFWWWMLFYALASMAASTIDSMVLGFDFDSSGPTYVIFLLATAIPNFAVTARRLHDIDRSGWWMVVPYGIAILAVALAAITASILRSGDAEQILFLLPLIAIAAMLLAFLILLIWLIKKGTTGENRFGPDPLESK